MTIGAMAMPMDFRYKDVFLKGMPVHEGWDAFRIKHPPMPASRWAKIFSPFDALKGFDEEISAKEVRYVDRIELDEDEKRSLDRKLFILRNYTYNSRMARANAITVTVEHFDGGLYHTTTGMVKKVDEIRKTLLLQTAAGELPISFDDLLDIRPERASLFEDVPEYED